MVAGLQLVITQGNTVKLAKSIAVNIYTGGLTVNITGGITFLVN